MFAKKFVHENRAKSDYPTRTGPDILRVVLGPYVQYCPCETSGQKLRQKPKSELKEIELNYCNHSICL